MSTTPVEPNYWLEGVRIGGPLLTAFGGALLANLFLRRNVRADRAFIFREKQINLLYGPLNTILEAVQTQLNVRLEATNLEAIREKSPEPETQKAELNRILQDEGRLSEEHIYAPLVEASNLIKEHSNLAEPELIQNRAPLILFITRFQRRKCKIADFDSVRPLIEHVQRRYAQLQAEHMTELTKR